MVGFIIDLTLFIIMLTYMVKYYKFKKMAEKEFIRYEKMLQESEYKIKEGEYMYESGVKMYQSEQGDLDPEVENQKIQEEQMKKSLSEGVSEGSIDLQPVMEKVDKIYKQKEKEVKKRMEAEKQAALALQRIEEVEKKIEDFRAMQNVGIDNFKKIASSLYKKIKIDISNISK